MQETPSDAHTKREELKALRKLFFRQFLKNPMDTQLAVKIRNMDDQIAECAEQIARESNVELSSRRFLPNPVTSRRRGPNPKKLKPGR